MTKKLTKQKSSIKKHLQVPRKKLEFYKKKDGTVGYKGLDDPEIIRSFTAAFGSMDFDIALNLFQAMMLSFGKEDNLSQLDLDFAFSFLQEMKAQDPVEAMLIIQMMGTHLKSCYCLGNSSLENQSFEGKDANINRATKLSRTFMMQMDALKKYRSNSNQKITVEHININEGGKAVIGSSINNNSNKGE